MGDPSGLIHWYAPDPRCIIELDDFYMPRRLARTIRQGQFEMMVNSAWQEVIAACSARSSTWITDDIAEVYTILHRRGYAHSVEAYRDGKLAGGLYGVSLGSAFMGESMFHTVSQASKVCLVYLVERLRQRGYTLLDCQYMTPHLGRFGAREIPRSDYLRRLEAALTVRCTFD